MRGDMRIDIAPNSPPMEGKKCFSAIPHGRNSLDNPASCVRSRKAKIVFFLLILLSMARIAVSRRKREKEKKKHLTHTYVHTYIWPDITIS